MKAIKLILFSLFFISVSHIAIGQNIDFDKDPSKSLYLRLYGNVDYNQKLEEGYKHNGKLDVHRIVTLFGYQFSRKTQFVAEIEVEHVKEIFIEQAWVKHKINNKLNLKAGLLLVPMGFVNEQHEPTFFYSVERPLTDKLIIPTTWREVGIGITGLFADQSLKYQLYAINNFLSYDDGSKLSASKGLRSSRQKGAESVISGLPALSAQVEYFGLENFKIGLSGFFGETNTSLNNGSELATVNPLEVDSTTVDLAMMAIHSTYSYGRLNLRAQYAIAQLGRVQAYNNYTGADAAKSFHGGYFVIGYNLLKSKTSSLSPFVRFEHIDNNLRTTDDRTKDLSLKQNIYTIGLNYKPDNGVVFKVDFQMVNNGAKEQFQNLNAGVGVWF